MNRSQQLLLFFSLMISSFCSYAQIDVTRYASEDLFSAKPIINEEDIVSDKRESITWFENELNKGVEFWSNGDYDDAVDLFERLIDENPDISLLHYYVGLINYERSDYQSARENFLSTLKIEPLFLEAKYMLGLISLEEEDEKTAKSHFKTLLNVPAYRSYGYHGKGLLSFYNGDPYGAYRNFKRCIEADSTFLDAYIPMITIDLYLGKLKTARKVVEKALRAEKDWQQGIMIRGIISLLQDKDTLQFEKDIDRLIELAPENYHYYSMKGFLKIELRQYHEAVKLFSKALNLEVDPNRTGEFKFNSKLNKDEATQRSINYYFENLVPNSKVRSYIDRAICEFILDNKKEALILLDSANIIQKTAVSYTIKGAINKSMIGRITESIEDFTDAIKLDSLNWMAYSYRGEMYSSQGKDSEAHADYGMVVKLKPNLKEGYKNRGIIYVKRGDYHKAYRDFSYAVAMDTSDYDLFFNRASIAMTLKQYYHAENDLKKIIKNKPDDGEAYYMIYKCRLYQSDTLDAIVYLDSASKFSKYKVNYHEELLQLTSLYSLDEQSLSAYNRLVKYNRWKYDYLLRRA